MAVLTRASAARTILLAPLRLAGFLIAIVWIVVAVTPPVIVYIYVVMWPRILALLVSPIVGLASPTTGRRLRGWSDALLVDADDVWIDRVLDFVTRPAEWFLF